MHRRHIIAIIAALALATLITSITSAAPSQDDEIHIVKRGETLATIAQQYGVSQQALIEANQLSNPSLIYIGQRLRIPEKAEAGYLPAQNQAGTTVYVVRPGDTLSRIAARYGVTVSQLTAINHLANPSLIRSGQRLMIPVVGTAVAEPAPTPASGVIYTVRQGDTLAAIAARYNTSVAALAAANNLANPSRIYSGQRLLIPDGRDLHEAPPSHQGGLEVRVSIGQQRCRVYRYGHLLYDWPCSTGRPGAGTRTGTFYVQDKIREAWGSAFGFYMPYWLGIYWAGATENGIHGLPYAPGGQPIWANAVGTPVTFGCILLGSWEARTLWEMAYIGMPVIITP